MDSFLKLIATVLISSTLIACGGGGGGGGGSSSGSSSQSAVSDGTSNTSTPSAKTVDITLSWVAPTTRENGDALLFSEINGYEIYYFKDGSDQQNDQVVSITNPNTVETTITNLTAGTYYFAIATLDIAGLSSDTSDYVELVID
ncbi:MAG: fibronectin type III domain-containing protein [Oceanicoccus sp.]